MGSSIIVSLGSQENEQELQHNEGSMLLNGYYVCEMVCLILSVHVLSLIVIPLQTFKGAI